MRTKLRRIEELLTRKKKQSERASGSAASLPGDLHETFDAEVKKLSGENDHLRDYNKKLRAVERDLLAKAVTTSQKKPDSKYGHVRGKLGNPRLKQSD